MTKTVHVVPRGDNWVVKREGLKAERLFGTQREAVEAARQAARSSASGQFVVHGRNGRFTEHGTYGMPKVQDAPGRRSERAGRIERAVVKVTRDRLNAEPQASLG